MPVIPQGTAANTISNVAGLTHTINIPASPQVGERLGLLLSLENSTGPTIPGWSVVQVSGGAAGGQIYFAYKQVTGAEASTATLTTSTATTLVGICWRLSGHDPAVAPETVDGNPTGTDVLLDPGAITPSWGQAETFFVVAATATADSRTFTVYPTGYTTNGNVGTSVGNSGLRMGWGYRSANVATEDPSTFTVSSGSGGQTSGMLAMKPAASSTRIQQQTDLRWVVQVTGSNKVTKDLEARWRVFFTAGTPGTVDESWSGAVTDTSFLVAGRHQSATTVRLVVSTNSSLTNPLYFGGGAPDAQGHIKISATGLTPNTQYYYGWESNGNLLATPRGRAKTFPSGAASFKIVVLGDAHRSTTNGVVPDKPVYSRIADELPLIQLWTGDYYYESNAESFSTNIATYRTMWHSTFDAGANRDRLINEIPFALTWGDHDSIGNNATKLSPGWTQAHQNFRQIFPHYPLPSTDRITQDFTIGRVKFFLLDVQSYRDPPETTDSSSKSMLGTAQKAEFKAWLLANPNAAKVVVSSYPWHGVVDDNEGHWGYYPNEQTELVNYIAANNIRNIVMVGSDMHAAAFAAGNTPGNLTAGQIPVIQAAPAFRPGPSHKGGPWDKGPFPPLTATQPEQYGLLTVTDTGGANISLVFSARDETGTPVFSDSTITFTNVSDAPTLTRIDKSTELRWRVLQSSTRIQKDTEFRWKVAGTQDTDIFLAWQAPPENLVAGTALQEFRIEARKVGSGTPLLSAWLHEFGIQRALLTDVPVTSTSGQVFSAFWDAALLNDIGGGGVELRVLIEGTTSGYGELVDAEWNATHLATPDTRVRRDLDARWRVNARVERNLTAYWRIFERISQESSLRWRVLSTVGNSVELRWKVGVSLASVSKDADLRWRALQTVGRSAEARWKLHTRMGRNMDFRWRVEAAVAGRVNRDIGLSWRTLVTLTPVSQSTDLRWRTFKTASADVNLLWVTRSRVWMDADLRWVTSSLSSGIGEITSAQSVEAGNATSHDVPVPAGTGGWLIGFAAINANPAVTSVPWGATILVNQASSALTSKALVFAKLADGTETASTFVTDSARQSATRVFRVTGANALNLPEVLTISESDQTPDPPLLDPSWGEEEAAWFAASMFVNGNTLIDGYPGGYEGTARTATGTGSTGVTLGTAYRVADAETEDPSSFTLNLTRASVSVTLAVRSAVTSGAAQARKDLDLRWRTSGRISRDLDVRWRTLVTVSQDLEARWQVHLKLQKDLDFRWSVEGVPGRIQKDLDFRWRVLRTLQKDLDFRWRVLGLITSVARDAEFRWRASARIRRDAEFRWRTAAFDFIIDEDDAIRPKIYAVGEVKPKVYATWEVKPKLVAVGQIEENVYAEGYSLE